MPIFQESVARALPDPPPAEPDLAADAQTVLAAIRRMEAAIRSEPSTMERLRAHLADMAHAIAQAKGAIKPDAAPGGKLAQVVTLLYQVESRVEEMIALTEAIASAPAQPVAGEAPAPAHEAAEPAGDRVPTVSDVVSRLNRPAEVAADAGPIAEPPTDDPAEDMPTFPMLEAMVEALISSAEAVEARNLADWAADAAVDAARRTSESEPAAPAERPHDPILPEIDLLPELDLLSSFARMRAVPHPPPELGAAVIFPKASSEQPAATEPPMEAPAALPHAEPPAVIALPAAPMLLLAPPAPKVIAPPENAIAPPPLGVVEQPTIAESPARESNGSAENEPEDVVAEPSNDDAGSAAFLLEPPSPIAAAPAAAADEIPDEPPADPEPNLITVPLQREARLPPLRPQLTVGTPLDPLRPLRSMSDDEKIALFS